jgi:hypothetical protein
MFDLTAHHHPINTAAIRTRGEQRRTKKKHGFRTETRAKSKKKGCYGK